MRGARAAGTQTQEREPGVRFCRGGSERVAQPGRFNLRAAREGRGVHAHARPHGGALVAHTAVLVADVLVGGPCRLERKGRVG